VVWLATSELLVFVAGSGDGGDELGRAFPRHTSPQSPSNPEKVSVLVRAVLACLQAATYKAAVPGSLASLREAPGPLARAAVLLDELCSCGVIESSDPETLHAGVSLSMPVSEAA
jgi:hypothetical protein